MQAFIISGDVEGKIDSMETEARDWCKMAFSDDKEVCKSVKYVIAGDLHDNAQMPNEKFPNAKTQKQIDDHAFNNLQSTLVFGNRDLNKLRFKSELSEPVLEFIGGLIRTAIISDVEEREDAENKFVYYCLKTFYWTVIAKRDNQRKSAASYREVFGKLTDELRGEIENASFQTKFETIWLRFLTVDTMGIREAEYTARNVYGDETSNDLYEGLKGDAAFVRNFFTSRESPYFKLMSGGTLAFLHGHFMVQHSGLQDFDWLLSRSSNPYNVYGMVNGIRAYAVEVNEIVKSSLVEYFEEPADDDDGRILVSNVNLVDIAQIQYLDAKPTLVKELLFTPTDHAMHSYSSYWESSNQLANENLLNQAYTAEPRKAESLMDAALPFPVRHPLLEELEVGPGIATNNNVQFYVKAQAEWLAFKNAESGSMIPRVKAHLCDMVGTGGAPISLMVLGHMQVPGPLVINFNDVSCEGSDVSVSVAFVFIDPSGYYMNTATGGNTLQAKQEVDIIGNLNRYYAEQRKADIDYENKDAAGLRMVVVKYSFVTSQGDQDYLFFELRESQDQYRYDLTSPNRFKVLYSDPVNEVTVYHFQALEVNTFTPATFVISVKGAGGPFNMPTNRFYQEVKIQED